MLITYYEKILNISGYGDNSTATYIAGQYAEDNGGIFVMAEHLIDDRDDGSIKIGANEWDFYNDCLINEQNTHYFFNYTPSIAYSMVSEVTDDEDAQEYKTRIYNVGFRPKMMYEFSEKYKEGLKKLRMTKMITHNPNYSFGSSKEFLRLMKLMG